MRHLSLLLAVLAGCSLDVDYTGTFFQCGEGDSCPEGYVCKQQICIPTEPTPQACTTALAAGDNHTCMIRDTDASVWCWGRNNQGQLGNGSTVDSSLPTQVTGITGAVALAAAGEFSCAVVGEGREVRCWGANMAGQLGDGSTTSSRDPVTVGNLGGVTSLAAGSQHVCAVSGGRVSCWGDNSAGQLGDTTTSPHRTPAPATISGTVTELAAGGNSTCAIVDGELACWGSNSHGQFMLGTNEGTVATPAVTPGLGTITTLSVGGGGHVCIVTSGEVKCAGNGGSGQLGNGTNVASTTAVDAFIPAPVVSIRAGIDHTCAVDEADRIWCWGSSNEGKLPLDGVSVSTASPLTTVFEPANAITLGANHTCIRTLSGAISCAGTNGQGQLGIGLRTTEPNAIPVEGLTNIATLISGDRFSCAADMAGVTRCWGLNSSGQLGDGGFQNRAKPTPALISNVEKLHAGGSYACAERTDGSIACWGAGNSGQLGAGTTTRPTPLTIAGVSNVDQLALGDDHTCALTGTAMQCWGDNNSGKLGDPAASSGPTPVPLNNGLVGTPTSIAISSQHTCVIDSASEVQCWGVNNSGVLGRATGVFGDAQPAPAPVKLRTDTLASLTGVDELRSRGTTVFARAGGNVFAWGNSCPNILGASTAVQCSNDAAAQVDNVGNAAKMSIGFGINCVVKDDTTVACWGNNFAGQIGDGSYNFAFATAVAGLTGVTEVAAGSDHVCALKSDRTVVCWGNAAQGQLGNGVLDDRGPSFVRLTCGE